MLKFASLLRTTAIGLWLLSGTIILPATSAAQSPGPLTPSDILPDGQAEGLSSPVYAASPNGSPYGEVYSRTFGASGDAYPGGEATTANPPPPPAPAEAAGEVVYVIDSYGLQTYRATDYGRGTGAPIGHNPQPLPAATASSAPLQVPTVADNLYLQPPLETAAGPQTPASAEPGTSTEPGASPGLAPLGAGPMTGPGA